MQLEQLLEAARAKFRAEEQAHAATAALKLKLCGIKKEKNDEYIFMKK